MIDALDMLMPIPATHRGESSYTLDGKPLNIVEFLRDNDDYLSTEQLRDIETLDPGESLVLGGGAGAEFILARVA